MKATTQKIFFLALIFFQVKTKVAGQDNYSGKWVYETPSCQLTLNVGSPDHQVAYPALLEIKSDSFQGYYYTLLAKKDFRRLFLSREKWIREESENTGMLLRYLSGVLHYRKDLKGNGLLELERLPCMDCEKSNHSNSNISFNENIIKSENILFKRIEDKAYSDTGFHRILQPGLSPVFFGIKTDTLITTVRDAGIHFSEAKDNDILSLKMNQQVIMDEFDASEKRTDESFFLDTGVNHLILFSENYGKKKTANGGVELLINKSRYPISFDESKTKQAIFLLQRIMYADPAADPWKIDRKKYPEIDWDRNRRKTTEQTKKNKKSKEDVIGEIITRSAELTFAIWDDAVEDGDSISLQINDEWMTQGFPVKNKPQFLKIKLTPGPNVITFLADNLGSISPNTSVLEIIDGSKRKSFHIETDKDRSNQVRIYYEIN
jgi:hypothetical protein